MLSIPQATGIVELVLPRIRVGIIGNLVVVRTQLRHQAQLVGRIGVVQQRNKSAVSVTGIVNWLLNGRLQSILAAITVEAGVPGEFLRMVPQAELIIGLIKVAQR